MNNKDKKDEKKRWPWNNYDDEENHIEPYDEYEDIKRNSDDSFNCW